MTNVQKLCVLYCPMNLLILFDAYHFFHRSLEVHRAGMVSVKADSSRKMPTVLKSDTICTCWWSMGFDKMEEIHTLQRRAKLLFLLTN